MAVIEVPCRYCSQQKSVIRYGKSKSGKQRFHCNDCCKSFQCEYCNNAYKPGVTEQIVEMTMNGSGVRDISRVLKISLTTVVTYLKNCPLHK
ncbi:MAG: IS1-like element transposase [Endozoicomonas sp. (ex Botrylloides leachii)]|nr:IS1-like element transposase [Endozoicomonas sp. (ex Botrylloides leachii)]